MSLRYLLVLRRFGGSCGLRRRRFRFGLRRRLLRLLLTDGLDHAAALGGRSARRHVREREAQDEKHGRHHGGGAREEIRRAGGAEEAPRGAAAKARAHVGALAMLKQHQPDDRQGDQHMKHDKHVRPQSHHLPPTDPGFKAASRRIATKSSATSEAPPIRPPSTSGMAKIAAAFCGLTLPPYRMRTPALSFRRRNACTACACSGVALRPVPIAHTGSYASTAAPNLLLLNTASSCRATTCSVRPASRSASVSPTQRIGVNPAACAAENFAATWASV